eukprot:snap_masked-scaffold835_size90571-processed-gene-0.4 protein:Tk02831 transcript:snap_masked-scaffold835_size90571-processed-gene-0.4-mRNA-1 annotation:"hypothetical protein DAPPUDRAFT_112094"
MPVMSMTGLLMTGHLGVTTMAVIVPVALVVLLPRGMMSLAVIFHFGHISFVAVHVVSDGLDTTIGQLDVIFALGHFAIAMLIVAKVRAVIVVMDFVAIFVVGWMVVVVAVMFAVISPCDRNYDQDQGQRDLKTKLKVQWFLSLPQITLALILVLGSVVLGDDKHHGYHDHHPAYYKYGYKVHDDYHGTDFGHNEHRDGKVTKGEYHVKLPDGRVQTVTYYVDGYKGYVAEVKYHGKAHHPAGKKHHKGYGHDHGHDHGHGGHSEVYAVMSMIMAGLLMTIHLRMTTMPVSMIMPVIVPVALVVLLPRGMMSLAVVFHLGHISFVAVHVVSDGLDTTIRQLDVIFALGHFAITMLVVAKVRSVIVVMDFVAVFVVSWMVVVVAVILMVLLIAVMPVIMAGILMTMHLGMATMPVIVPVIVPVALVVLLPRGMMSLAVVFHLGHISFVAIHVVGDSLDTTIGQLDVIFALGHVSIAMLIVAKVRAMIVVMDFVAVFVLFMICLSIGLAICLGSVVLAEEGKHHGHHDHHPAYYKYGYKVHDDYLGTDFGHNEHRDGKVTKGEYHVKLPDGRVQTVTYYVDGYKGYVAEVKYHGTAHHPEGKKHHKGYGHDHGHDHGHGGHSEVPAKITGITGMQITDIQITDMKITMPMEAIQKCTVTKSPDMTMATM